MKRRLQTSAVVVMNRKDKRKHGGTDPTTMTTQPLNVMITTVHKSKVRVHLERV